MNDFQMVEEGRKEQETIDNRLQELNLEEHHKKVLMAEGFEVIAVTNKLVLNIALKVNEIIGILNKEEK